jgi:hypothetical protein
VRGRYLEVTFRKGRPVAAYLYLPRRGTEHAARVSKASPGLLIDFNPAGKPIGIEITAPGGSVSPRSIVCSRVFANHGSEPKSWLLFWPLEQVAP